MGLFKDWQELALQQRTQEEYDEFWNDYLEKEIKAYKIILQKKDEFIRGKVPDLAKLFDMEMVYFIGFLQGINESLVNIIDVEKIRRNSDVKLEVDFEKLYYNMLKAGVEDLYNLKEWEDALSSDVRKEIQSQFKKSETVVKGDKIGRNDPCPCGSGKKYKKCCGSI